LRVHLDCVEGIGNQTNRSWKIGCSNHDAGIEEAITTLAREPGGGVMALPDILTLRIAIWSAP
jgi:hypothetical protein